MPFATSGAQRIHYADSGGRGPAVVFSHGFFMDQDMWDPQVEELRPTYRCLAVDARGFGLTEYDGEPFTYWDLADDIIAVMDDAGVDTAILVGLSQGGFTTQRAAVAHPDRVRAIVLCDTDCEVETDETKPMYYGTKDALLANGWSDDLANAMAGMLFAPGYDASFWVERWQKNPPERIAAAGCARRCRRRDRRPGRAHRRGARSCTPSPPRPGDRRSSGGTAASRARASR